LLGAGVVVVFGAVVAGCSSGESSAREPAYEAANLDADWTDPGRGGSNAVVVHDETVCSTQRRELYCVSADTGNEAFAVQLPGEATSPVLVGEILLVADDGGSGGMLHGYSLDGRQLWTSELDIDEPVSTQLRDGGPLVAGDVVAWVQDAGASRQIVAVDVGSGQQQWQQPATDVHGLYADGHQLYVATDHGALVALDASGARLWQAQLDDVTGDGTVLSLTPVLDGTEVAVVVDGEPDSLVVIDAVSGALRWDLELDGVGAEGISVASDDGVIYVNDDDHLRAFDETGDVDWGAPAAGGSLGQPDTARLVAEHDRLFSLSDSVWDIDTTGGGGKRVRKDVNASDVAVVADHVIVAGAAQLEAVPLLER
jgi:outer membrane protein assembly factor BamB